MKIIPLLLLAAPAWATAYTAVGTNPFQLWGTTSVWSPPGIPGDGDTVNIPDGITVTVSQNTTIGTSPPAQSLGPRRGPRGSIAISLNNSGRLIIFQTVALIVRGDIVYNAANCANTTNALLMLAGCDSRVRFLHRHIACHHALLFLAPTGITGAAGSGRLEPRRSGTRCFPTRRAGAGLFSMRGNAGASGSFVSAYTDFTNIGDASNPGWQLGFEYSGNNYIQWNVAYSTFTNCGKISYPNPTLGIGTNGVFRHSYNVHNQTASNEIFDGWINLQPIGTGIREIRNNVFDKSMSLSYFQTNGFIIWSNYFGEATQFGGGGAPWAGFQGNFYRESSSSLLGYTMGLQGDACENYWLLDEAVSSNPRGLNIYNGAGSQVCGSIVDHTGYLASGISAFWVTSFGTPAAANYAFLNNILLPNAQGGTSWWITAVVPVTSGTTLTIEHNTVVANLSASSQGAGLVTRQGGGTPTNGMIASYRSNILWNSGPAASYKALASGGGTSSDLDACAPTACDYNDGWNMLSDGSGFSNGGDGYADNFSAVPGQHDLSANPMFLDTTRNMATFDSAYLHRTATAWSGAAAYTAGSLVSSADSTVYQNAAINYRYTNGSYGGTNCSGSQSQARALYSAPLPRLAGMGYALGHSPGDRGEYHQRRDLPRQRHMDDGGRPESMPVGRPGYRSARRRHHPGADSVDLGGLFSGQPATGWHWPRRNRYRRGSGVFPCPHAVGAMGRQRASSSLDTLRVQWAAQD